MTSAGASGPGLGHRLLRVLGHQHWIRRGRDRLLRRLDNPEGHPRVPFTVDFFGRTYSGDLANFIDWSVYYYGCYARSEILLLGDLVRHLRATGRPRITALDVGANVGHHMLFLSTVADHVIAVEPYAEVRAQTAGKIAANGLHNVTLLPVGFAAADAVLSFVPPAGENSGTGSFHHPEGTAGTIPLRVRRGDDALAEIAAPRLDLVKIDVEGFERDVLAGLAGRLAADRPALLMELSTATRTAFASASGLQEALPPDYGLHAVRDLSVSGPYALEAFDFQGTDALLALPREVAGFASPGRRRS